MVPSILGMTGALARHGEKVAIVTPTPSRLDTVSVEPGLTIAGPDTNLKAAVRSAEVVHIHGLWQAHLRNGAKAARVSHVPYLITAHGMAEPWALRHKRWKKTLYLTLVEYRNLRHAACLQALAQPEIEHLRRLAPWVPIALIPNGVNLEFFHALPARSALESEYPELKDKFILLFFGRVHVKKGLNLLAKALKSVASDFPELHLLIAGNDDGAWKPFREQVAGFSLARRVTYLGHVSGEQARKVWAAADAFTLPSYSEGFSMAILEALAASVPCLITSACHFPELAHAQGALVVDPTEDAVTQGLRELLEMTRQERQQMAQNGKQLVERRYTWDQQAVSLLSVYRWLSGGGPQPACIIP
ncbi:MAG: glycosyltransferase [Isosphaeraceae bacterium]